MHLFRGCSVALGAALVVSFLNFTLEPAGVSSPRHARVEGHARRQVRRSIFLIGESVAYNVSPSAGRRRRRAATDRRSSSTCSAALGGPTRNHRATPRGFAASRRRSAGSMARFPEAGPPRAGLTCLRTGLIPRDGACLGVGGVLALEAGARAGAAHDGRAEFTGTAVSWGIHLFQVPFHPVWVERRLARVEVSRPPARHVGGPRVEV